MKKLMVLGVGLAMLNFTSCKKGDEDPGMTFKSRAGRLAGDWTVSEYTESSSSKSTYEDAADIDDELLSSEETMEISYDGSSMTYSETWTDTYDGKGYTDSRTGDETGTGTTITVTETEKNDEGTFTETQTGTFASTFSYTVSFAKDGTFEMKKQMDYSGTFSETETGYTRALTRSDNETNTISGTWSFINKNKGAEFKNKERIGLWFESNNTVSTNKYESVYTDTDASDPIDYTSFNSSSEGTNNSTTTGSDSEPDMVWELIKLSSKEMKVTYVSTWTNSGVYTNTQTYFNGTSTITESTDTDSDSNGESSVTMTLTK